MCITHYTRNIFINVDDFTCMLRSGWEHVTWAQKPAIAALKSTTTIAHKLLQLAITLPWVEIALSFRTEAIRLDVFYISRMKLIEALWLRLRDELWLTRSIMCSQSVLLLGARWMTKGWDGNRELTIVPFVGDLVAWLLLCLLTCTFLWGNISSFISVLEHRLHRWKLLFLFVLLIITMIDFCKLINERKSS